MCLPLVYYYEIVLKIEWQICDGYFDVCDGGVCDGDVCDGGVPIGCRLDHHSRH